VYSKIVILTFPKELVRKSLVCELVRKYDLQFNILSATISNKKEGHMVLEISSVSRSTFNKGITFLKDQGVSVSSPEHRIYKNEEICTHCGSCTAVCPTEALYISRPGMEVIFDQSKCSVCELCVITCPSRAMGLFAEEAQELGVRS
jgi:L-aspartate semialdehyde sulfurtransferase ferredoxin